MHQFTIIGTLRVRMVIFNHRLRTHTHTHTHTHTCTFLCCFTTARSAEWSFKPWTGHTSRYASNLYALAQCHSQTNTQTHSHTHTSALAIYSIGWKWVWRVNLCDRISTRKWCFRMLFGPSAYRVPGMALDRTRTLWNLHMDLISLPQCPSVMLRATPCTLCRPSALRPDRLTSPNFYWLPVCWTAGRASCCAAVEQEQNKPNPSLTITMHFIHHPSCNCQPSNATHTSSDQGCPPSNARTSSCS